MSKRVLTIRTDAIGDAILWSGAIERLRRVFPDDRHAVLCRRGVSPIYAGCPYLDDVLEIEFDEIEFSDQDAVVAAGIANRWGADIVLDPIRSKSWNAHRIVRLLDAEKKMGIDSDTANATPEERDEILSIYDVVLPAANGCTSTTAESRHHEAFLKGLGETSGEAVRPRVWLVDQDCQRAEGLLAEHGLERSRCMAVFPGSRWRTKRYPRWAAALCTALDNQDEIDEVLVMGGPDASEEAASIVRELASRGVRVVDLVAATDLGTTIAIIRECRVCVGVDTFAIHAACALDMPNAVVLGGGHAGRFLPYSSRTHAAMLPLDCYGCDWRCRHPRVHCIADIDPETVADAIVGAIRDPSAREPQVYVPGVAPGDTGSSTPVGLPSISAEVFRGSDGRSRPPLPEADRQVAQRDAGRFL